MKQKKWSIKSTDEVAVRHLHTALGKTREALCRLFVARELDTMDKVREFFQPCLSRMISPWELKDMEKAVERTLRGIRNGEHIMIFGDYDVDGTAAVAMLYRFLTTHYSKEAVTYYIPCRYKEGYGLSHRGIEEAITRNASLIITVDCGITSAELIAEFPQIDFIICDHHLPAAKLPEAVAVLNPKQPGCGYTFKELCGAGVTFKLIKALCQQMGLEDEHYLCYVELLMLATAADVVPVTGENRIFTHFGLQRMHSSPSVALKALINAHEKALKKTLADVSFYLAPKINAAGRMEHGRLAVELFVEDNIETAQKLASRLHQHNLQRMKEDEEVTEQALALLQEREAHRPSNSSVVFREGWHPGVLGIVASRLIRAYYRPTIVLTMGQDHIAGSARSIKGFNIYEALLQCEDLLVSFGGHIAAAGLRLLPQNLEAFAEKFESVAAALAAPHGWVEETMIDVEIELKEIDWPFYNTIKRMEPFGHANPEPVFLSRNVEVHPSSRILKEKHVQLLLQVEAGKYIRAIAFNMYEKFLALPANAVIDVVYMIREHEWNDQKSLQLQVVDFKPAGQQS